MRKSVESLAKALAKHIAKTIASGKESLVGGGGMSETF
jgi:hypothetical protein